jgi:hypothetical protein
MAVGPSSSCKMKVEESISMSDPPSKINESLTIEFLFGTEELIAACQEKQGCLRGELLLNV